MIESEKAFGGFTVRALVLIVGCLASILRADGPFAVLKPQEVLSGDPDRAWIAANAPLFECSDPEINAIYNYRWHVYHEHLTQTPAGWIVTEFLPNVPWAGEYNSISCAAGHHIYEGRWLRDPQYMTDYERFWFHGGGEPRRYSFWVADAIYARYLASGDKALPTDLLPDLIRNYQAWEQTHGDGNGLFWQSDDRDGMEYSIGGSGYRPTINSYMYGDARAISRIAMLAGDSAITAEFAKKADALARLVRQKLWDPKAKFFETLPRGEGTTLVGVREEVGFVPWYFNLPSDEESSAWQQLKDPEGFAAPFGPTTAEQRSARFNFAVKHDCLWNGPSWPYATTQTLVGMANLLNNYHQNVVNAGDYLSMLRGYTRSQFKDGKPHLAEDLDAITGKWIVDLPRSVDYNHSGYGDLIITGLVGLRPRPDNQLEINPLVPEGALSYFCLDGVSYHGHLITIVYDQTGQRYGRGAGLKVIVDGKNAASAPATKHLMVALADAPKAAPQTQPGDVAETAAGWKKYAGNPVLGGALGTCFDVCVLKDAGVYRMYFSWRPKKSVALTESRDGIHWSVPEIVLGPNLKSAWEADINRPVVLKKNDGYHMWYTGQADKHSRIGYATSDDGKTWKRQSERPVLSPEKLWEKVAVMCPDVLWDENQKQFRMWYSAGDQYEPDAIGYATSADGLTWTRRSEPVFRADPAIPWEQLKVTACQVVPDAHGFLMFYIGFSDVNHAQIGVARSPDGIGKWERLPANPIIRPGAGQWDADACYKPFAIFDGQKWLLWYNGRHRSSEQIGLAIHEGRELGFNTP